MAIFCSQCGKKLPDDAQFCMKCGSAVTPRASSRSRSPEKQENKKEKGKSLSGSFVKFAAISCIGGFLLLIIGAVLSGRYQEILWGRHGLFGNICNGGRIHIVSSLPPFLRYYLQVRSLVLQL